MPFNYNFEQALLQGRVISIEVVLAGNKRRRAVTPLSGDTVLVMSVAPKLKSMTP